MFKLVTIIFVVMSAQQEAKANAANVAAQLAITNYLFVDHPKDLGVRPIQVDGCSSSPEGWWRHCCIEHDINYWIGGDQTDRLYADQTLYNCMDKVGGPAGFYFSAVRSFGSTAWNVAWPKMQGRYQRLSRSQCQTTNSVIKRWSETQFFRWAEGDYKRMRGVSPQYASIKKILACRQYGELN